MSLVLKSNKVATASLGNINGIRGTQDWFLFADFENQEYVKKVSGNRVELDLLDVLNCTSNHNLATQPITVDRYGNESIITVPNQIRTMREDGRFGVLVEASRSNHFRNTASPETQVITLAGASPIAVSCTGSGSVVVSGASIETKVVTEKAPQVFISSVTSGNIDITCTISGTLSHVQVERVGGFTNQSTKITSTHAGQTGSTTRQPDFVKLKAGLLNELLSGASGITVVMQSIPIGLVKEARASVPESKLTVRDSTGASTFVGANRLPDQLSARLLSYDASNISTLSVGGDRFEYTLDQKAIVHAAVLTNKAAKVSINGQGILSGVTSTSMNLAEIDFLGGSVTPNQQGSGSILAKLAIYKRALSDAEIRQISQSWM